MKKIFLLILAISLFLPSVLADGGMIHYHEDQWQMLSEDQQLAAINYKDGYQNMILSVRTNTLKGEKAVWIFPVPSKPEDIAINIIKGFPVPYGSDVQEKADDALGQLALTLSATQVYPAPFVLFTRSFMAAGELSKAIDALPQGIIVHETIEKMGLTTELISTTNTQDFFTYIESKDLSIPDEFQAILNDYLGKDYSFVVSWISDVNTFKKEQQPSQKNYPVFQAGNKLGVFITFPTEKIYFPLKPTSVYGSKQVPATIYVMDYVTPQLYPGISANAKVEYLYTSSYYPKPELRDFFFNQNKINDLSYTKITLNPPSKFLTEDLWMELSAPLKVTTSEHFYKNAGWYGLIIFLICSVLASYIAGLLIFHEHSKKKFTLFGLFNFLTLIGFGIATYFFKSKEVTKNIKDYFNQKKELFVDQKRTYALIALIFLGIIIIWLIIGRFIGEGFSQFLFILTIPTIIFFSFHLSKEKLTTESQEFLKKNNQEIKAFNFVKFIFILAFNGILSFTLITTLIANHQLNRSLAKALGFVGTSMYGHTRYYEGNNLVLALWLVFALSLLILIVGDRLRRNKKHLYLIPKDSWRKPAFVAVFSVTFILLLAALIFLLKLFI